MIVKFAWLALAGALGTIARYSLSGVVQRFSGGTFPWGTAVVNLVGCLVAGFLWALFEKKGVSYGLPRTIILVGFMGAFTTFSTLILQTTEMMRASELLYASGNLVLQNGVGLLALVGGIYLGRLI